VGPPAAKIQAKRQIDGFPAAALLEQVSLMLSDKPFKLPGGTGKHWNNKREMPKDK
jgi:hypothetical protein